MCALYGFAGGVAAKSASEYVDDGETTTLTSKELVFPAARGSNRYSWTDFRGGRNGQAPFLMLPAAGGAARPRSGAGPGPGKEGATAARKETTSRPQAGQGQGR